MNLSELKKMGVEYDSNQILPEPDSAAKTKRLKALVDKHGVSSVAAVLGLSESSILVYTRHKNSKYGCVSNYNVVKAEEILNKL
jgi:hypothetical protein